MPAENVFAEELARFVEEDPRHQMSYHPLIKLSLTRILFDKDSACSAREFAHQDRGGKHVSYLTTGASSAKDVQSKDAPS